jgi:hypothetical protein
VTTAAELDWSTIQRFRAGEWPDGTLQHMDGRLIRVLDRIRNRLPKGHSMTPSPLRGAHVRESGTSRHSTQGGRRLSDATDIFMRWSTVWDAWAECLRDPAVGGLGIYVDTFLGDATRTRPMLHIDLRPERLMWVCWRVTSRVDPFYTYHHLNPLEFHKVLAGQGFERLRT